MRNARRTEMNKVWVDKSERSDRGWKNNIKIDPNAKTEWRVLNSSVPWQGQSAGLL